MATHDYVIDNQTAPNFRADLNNALLAIVSNNSSATAPAVTYANMMWYDTAANILYMRNEDNDAWIRLGTLDQTADTFSAAVALASQAEAEAGTDNTKVMTPLRVKQSVVANVPDAISHVLLGTLNTTSGTTQTLSGLSLAGYKFLKISVKGAKHDAGGITRQLAMQGIAISGLVTQTVGADGILELDLSNFVGAGVLTGLSSHYAFSSITTSITFSWLTTGGVPSFTAGEIKVYGVK